MTPLVRLHKSLMTGGLVVVLLLLFSSEVRADTFELQSDETFAVDAISVKGTADHRTRLDLYARVPYTTLRFLSAGDRFRSTYTMSVEVHRLDGRDDPQFVAARASWERSVISENYATTRSAQRFDRSTHSVELRPGRYLVIYQMEDDATDVIYEKTLPVTVRDYSGRIGVSDILMLDNFNQVSNTITPRASREVSSSERSISFFYEMYADDAQEVRIRRQLIRTERSGGIPVIGSILRLGRSETQTSGEIDYTQVDARRVNQGRTPFTVSMPLEDARVGEYLLRIQVEDPNGQILDEVEKSFNVRWRGLMAHIRNLDEAIEQLRYVAKDSDIEHIKSASTEQERMNRFMAFWEKRDPTPGSQRNERMEEYYYRVARANRTYIEEQGEDAHLAGWETDRGHVMVRYGEPDRVERRPFSAEQRPYEIWHYERIGRRFIFLGDEQGSFQLVEPSWSDPSRIR